MTVLLGSTSIVNINPPVPPFGNTAGTICEGDDARLGTLQTVPLDGPAGAVSTFNDGLQQTQTVPTQADLVASTAAFLGQFATVLATGLSYVAVPTGTETPAGTQYLTGTGLDWKQLQATILVHQPDGTEANASRVAVPVGSTVSSGTLYLPGSFGIENNALADGDVNIPYTQTVTAFGGVAPYTWTAVGSLPAGLTLAAATGAITGTPTAQQSYAFTLVCTDAIGSVASQSYSVTIHSLSSKYQRMFGASIILWAKENEPSGTVVVDSSATHSNGTYTNVTLGGAGVGDGGTAAAYTAAPISSANVFTPALAAAIEANAGTEITALVWGKLDDAASWAANVPWNLYQYTGPNNLIDVIHVPTGDMLQFRMGATATSYVAGLSGTDWFHSVLTYSYMRQMCTLYHNGAWGAQAGEDDIWVGVLDSAKLGNAATPTANSAFPGKLAHHMLLNRSIVPSEAAEAYRLQESGVWDVYGTVLEPSDPALANQFVGEPNLSKGPPVILTGPTSVFKLWYSAGDNQNILSVCYAESYDCKHWVNHPNNPIVSDLHRASGPVQLAGVHYMVMQTPGYRLGMYTSPDGITWTLLQSNIIDLDVVETATFNSWLGYDATEAHPWILMYEYSDNVRWHVSLAQADSPQGPWTKSANNPIIDQPNFGVGVDGMAGGPFAHKSVDGSWTIWYHAGHPLVPTDIYRARSAVLDAVYEVDDPIGPTLPRYNPESLFGAANSQLSDVSLLRDGDTTYMVYCCAADQNKSALIALATTPLTIDQIAQTSEGIIPTANHEQLCNPSFEVTKVGGTTFAFWTDTVSNGAVARTTTVGEVVADSSRLAACKLTAGAATATCTTQVIDGLIPGRSYILSGMGRGDGTHAGRVRVQNSATTDLIAFAASLTTTAAVYAPFSFSFVAPADGNVTISLWCPATSGGIAYFDNMSLKRA